MGERFPTDINTLAELGGEKFLKEHPCWPIPDEQYFDMVESFISLYSNALLSLKPAHRDILLSDFAFVNHIAYVAHARVAESQFRNLGMEPAVGPFSKHFYDPDWDSLSQIREDFILAKRMKFFLKAQAKNIIFNKHLALWRRITGVGASNVLGLGSFTWLKAEYSKMRGYRVKNFYMPNLFTNNLSAADPPSELTGLTRELAGSFSDILEREFGCSLQVKEVAHCWSRRIGTLNQIYESVSVHRGLPNVALVTEAMRPQHKALVAAYKTSGRTSVAFHHGNLMGGVISKLSYFNEFCCASIYVSPTARCAETLAKYYTNFPAIDSLPVRFVNTETERYRQLHTKFCTLPLPESVDTVMLMGFPMNGYRYFGLPGYFFYYQIALELKLARLLVSRGYRVLYKVHPECINSVLDLIGPICNEVITEPFESCWERADAFIFKQTASTTFGFALCTNRPIVLLDTERSFWREGHYALIKRRCRMVPARMESDGVTFDEDALIEVLSRKPEPTDDAYVREFMYP